MLQKCSINMPRCFIELFIDIHVVRSIVIPQIVCLSCEECLYIVTMVLKILSVEAKDVLKHKYT